MQQRWRMMWSSVVPRAWGRAAVVVLGSVGGAWLLRWALTPVLHDAAPLLVFTAAVAFSAMLGGWSAGLAATLLSVVAGMALVTQSWAELTDPVSAARVAVFVLVGVVISVLTGQRDHAMGLYREMARRRSAEARAEQYQRQLRRMAERLVTVEQSERRRIASGLHDHLAHLLAACRQRLSMWRMRSGSAPDVGELEDMSRVMDEAIAYTRTLVSDLRPPVLDELGLGSALDWLAERFAALHGLRVELKECGSETSEGSEVVGGSGGSVGSVGSGGSGGCGGRMDERGRWALFVSVRELLFNVVKHAGVSGASVCVCHEPERVKVVVEDTGRGFDAGPSAESSGVDAETGGMGLFSVRERLDALGGGMEVDSAPGRGCRVTLWLPVQKTKSAAATGGGE